MEGDTTAVPWIIPCQSAFLSLISESPLLSGIYHNIAVTKNEKWDYLHSLDIELPRAEFLSSVEAKLLFD